MYDYKDKLITVDEAVDLIKDDFNIYFGWGFDHPKMFMDNMHKAATKNNVKRVQCQPAVCPYFCEFMKPDYRENFIINSLYQTPAMRKAAKNGSNFTFIPTAMTHGWKRSYRNHINLYVTETSMPDKHGYVSLSFDTMYSPRHVDMADIVIFEMNPNFPRTLGDAQIHIDRATYVTEANYPAPELPDAPYSEEDLKIAEIIADDIKDGDCIQVGIGTLPNAICHGLRHKKHLGIHSELMTSGLYNLLKCGAADNSMKNVHKGKSVCCFICGNREMYDYIDDNPSFRIYRGDYVTKNAVASEIDNFCAINCALNIDLTGQCQSETIGLEQISGTGGQNELTEAAQWSNGGRAYICMHSTSTIKDPETGEKKVVSNIVPFLEKYAMVSTLRMNTDRVVTEYGMVDLRGATIKERVKLLVSIAHPDFREELKQSALEMGYINDLDLKDFE